MLEVVEGNVRHAPDRNTAEFCGSAFRQAAHGLVEKEDELLGGVEDGTVGVALIRVEFEDRIICDRISGKDPFGHAEGRPAGHHRLE